MDEMIERMNRRNAFSIALAIVGKFASRYKETYKEEARPCEVTNFCLKLMMAYDGRDCGINDEQLEKIWVNCMEQARSDYVMLVAAPFEKLRKELK